jgi:hypothetical protein
MGDFKFVLKQGSRKGSVDDPFCLGGITVQITKKPEGIDHVYLLRLTYNGNPVPYVPFGFEFKMGIWEGSTATLSYIDRNHMGEEGVITFTMIGMQDGEARPEWGHMATAHFKYMYRDGSTELRPRKFKETLLNATLDALYEADKHPQEDRNKEMYVFELSHSNRRRKNVKIRGQYLEGGYPAKFSVPGILFKAMQREGLIVRETIQFQPGSDAERRSIGSWVEGRQSYYLNHNWVDFVRLVRDGNLVGYAWHPFGKMQLMSERNAQRLIDSSSVWDRLLGLIWGGRKPGQ